MSSAPYCSYSLRAWEHLALLAGSGCALLVKASDLKGQRRIHPPPAGPRPGLPDVQDALQVHAGR